MSWSGNERGCLFLNHGGKRFATASYVTGFDFADDGRGMALVDWDHDGDLDLWMCNRAGPQVRFLQNQLSGSRWLSLKLIGDGQKVNRDAVGSTVVVWVKEHGKEVPLKRSVTAGDIFLSQSSRWGNVGLADSKVQRIEIRWPDGTQQELPALQENRQYTLKYGDLDAQVWQRPFPAHPVKLAETPLDEPILENRGIRLVQGTLMPPLYLVDQDKKPAKIKTGKATLIKFWASWCPNCQKELKQLPRYKSYFEQVGVDIVLVNAEMNADGELKMAESPLPGFPNYFMGKKGGDNLQLYLNSVTVLHQKMKLPMSMLINDRGEVAAVYLGSVKAVHIARTALVAKKSRAWRYTNAVPFPGKLFNETIIGNADKVAKHFKSAGEFEYAALIYQNNLARFAKNAKVHVQYGECLIQLQRFEKAVEILEKAKNLEPKDKLKKQVFLALGVAYLRNDQLNQSEPMLNEALKLGEDAKTYYYLGVLADQSEHLAKAEVLYLKSIKLSKEDRPVLREPWLALSRLYREQGRSAELQHLIQQGKNVGVRWTR